MSMKPIFEEQNLTKSHIEHTPLLSIVVCVYNEENNIKPLIEAIYAALIDIRFELIYVDDGSTDATVKNVISEMRPGMQLIELQKNYGQSSALAAGIDHASGEYIVLMDGDLQNDPTDIPKMIDIVLQKNLDVLAGIRAHRKDGLSYANYQVTLLIHSYGA